MIGPLPSQIIIYKRNSPKLIRNLSALPKLLTSPHKSLYINAIFRKYIRIVQTFIFSFDWLSGPTNLAHNHTHQG